MVVSDLLTVIYSCRGHGSCFPSHANEAMGSSRKGMWTHIPVPAFLFVWQAAKPRTAQLKFYFTVATICIFAETMSPMYFWLFRRNHVANVLFDYFGEPSPKPISPLTLFFVLSTCWSYSTLWNLVWTPFDNIGCSTPFSRSTTRGSPVSLMV